MKKISIVIPTFNEETNVRPIAQAVINEFLENLCHYEYELIFIDNNSRDKTKSIIEEMCKNNINIKAIFNARNFGPCNSPYYGLLQSSGDCTILLCADFQDPIYMIKQFIDEWENGFKIVIGIKTSSEENWLMYKIRSIYYKLVQRFSDIDQIEHFTGFGLYDKSFIHVLQELGDPMPFLRGIVAELGCKRKDIPYKQAKRRSGYSHLNFYSLYDCAMLSITSYTKFGLRLAVFAGAIIAFCSMLIGFFYLILKLLYWNKFAAGTAPILIGMMFLGAVQIFFIGFIGEYILSINQRIMKRPLVIEEKRINF
ncbi:glycosyltransferase family 2 protein [Cloacibacillus porcorum]|uniref:glycosyltransferase family 2 protein n=1 Tax=Cloacibacillus porcorum TaxID=1197717 RepID=UPI0026718D72|nr:glycosyltransferase family 2 protein [Cloacibacillus porcorum]